ncbi:uncharacterized protein LOC128179469 [Crassostrea angulata]|uniref:uncharacterized protein LOC128179469 n=1 Tax=Magallana angulata TaxID=2784310 RepID=UPI0022B194BB|nr:uncharacterized protein LOC128179469 [Crassostrea angulata]XP_052702861.1 uncharacterized protein LOC128179469 [Crassostrea angulata]
MHRHRQRMSDMDDTCNTMKIFKVWNVNKTSGSLLGAQKLEELKMKVESKFEISSSEFHISLSDGCKVEDEDAFQLLSSGTELFVLTTGQSRLTGAPSSSLNDSDFSSSSTSPWTNLLSLVDNIRKRKTSLNIKKPATKKAKTSMKINIGWLHFDQSRNKYQQVKLKTGGGSRTVEMCISSSYKEILEKAIDIFFPAGMSSKGRIEKFSCVLGNFTQNLIKEDGFSLQQYTTNSCFSNKPRIYLMTKERIEQELPSLFELLSGDSSDDFDLPDLLYSTHSSPESLETDHQEHDAATVINTNDAATVSNQNDAATITNPNDAAVVTHPNDAPTVTNQNDAATITNPNDAAVVSHPNDAPTVTNPNGAATVTNPNDAAVVSHPNDAPTVTNQNDAATISNPNDAAVVSHPNDALTVTNTIDAATVINPNDVISVTNTNDAETVTNPDDDATVSNTNDAATVTNTHQMFETNPYLDLSPVTLRMPRIPTCTICSDRFSDAFLNCGHILCFVCATELTERGSICHICRQKFTTVSQLYY